ncbi:MAG: HD domain-containing protein [Thermodesulfovibrionales bacterium]|nr:HD domain-containing protein [Thermodesulfovibrionales bacterium]
MKKTYTIDSDEERYIPISLDSLVPGSKIPFEIYTYDGTMYKSLLDKGSTYSYFAQEMIKKQALSRFFIRQANALSFNEYLQSAAKLRNMILDPTFFESRYKEFRDKWFIIDKMVLGSGLPLKVCIGGLRFPVYGELPFSIENESSYKQLLDLNADIAIRKTDIDTYYTYLDNLLDNPEIQDVLIKVRIRREKLKVWCFRVFEEIRNNCLSKDTLLKLYKHITLLIGLIKNDFTVAGKMLFFDVSDIYLYIHSTNVCLMSMMHGHVMNMDDNSLFNLGISAILHDIGRIYIDDDAKEDSHDELQRQIYRSHVLKGKESLEPYMDIPSVAKIVALTHHEREDGSGYLYGLKGDKIHHFSKIIALSDTFERMRVRGYKYPVIKRTQILQEMSKNPQIYDAKLLKDFLKFVAGLSL